MMVFLVIFVIILNNKNKGGIQREPWFPLLVPLVSQLPQYPDSSYS